MTLQPRRTNGRRLPALLLLVPGIGLGGALLANVVNAEESKNLVTLQVRLLDEGAPLDADLDLTFKIYDVSSGGSPLWTEAQASVPVRNGILAVQLGTTTPLGNVFRSGLGMSTDRWVAVEQGGLEIVPRVQLTAVPYAQGASAAEIASTIWNQATGTALAITDLPNAIYGDGLEHDGAGRLRLASGAAGDGLTGGSGSPLAVDPDALINGGAAEIVGDRLSVAFVPTHYTRLTTGTIAQSTDELAAHLAGIDDALSSGGGGGGTVDGAITTPGGRLSLSSTTPVSSSDHSAATTLYYLPYANDRIPLHDGSSWVVRSIGSSGRSLSLSGATSTSTNYDVFAYWDGDSVELELGNPWNSATERNGTAGEISRVDGIWVRGSGGDQDATRRWVGTIRTGTTSGQTYDTQRKRFVWNLDNRVPRPSFTRDDVSWTTSSTSWVIWNNGDSTHDWIIEFLQGLDDRPVSASLQCSITSSSWPGSFTYVGLFLDGSLDTTNAALSSTQAISSGWDSVRVSAEKRIDFGYHYLEAGHATGGGNSQFYGNGAYAGMRVTVWN